MSLYEHKGLVGRGGFGTVIQAVLRVKVENYPSRIAIKTTKNFFIDGRPQIDMRDIASNWLYVNGHENIVEIFGREESYDQRKIAMELCHGDIAHYCEEEILERPGLEEMTYQVASGLAHLHQARYSFPI